MRQVRDQEATAVYEINDEARAAFLKACEQWIDQWDWTAGSVVTGFAVVVESVRPNGTHDLTWATGNGDPIAKDENAGIPAWRLLGMLERMKVEIQYSITRDIQGMMDE